MTPQPIAPDGRPELIVHLLEPYLERGKHGGTPQPRVFFAGQLTRPLTLVAKSGVAVIGARFHAFAARPFLGVDAAVATDARTALTVFHGEAAKRLESNLDAAQDGGQSRAIVEDYVERRLRGARWDEDVRRYVERMFDGDAPSRPFDVSERQWQRRFRREVGVSVKALQVVLRFRRVFDAIENPRTQGWLAAALDAGYFDQPQMARDFRRYLGCTARQWAAQKEGLARSLTRAVSDSYKTSPP